MSGMERSRMRSSSTYSSSGLPREIALPTMTMSGRGFRLASEYGCKIGMEIDARKSDIGGYAAASEPVTLKPRCLSNPASDAMAVPQIPMMCTCCCSTFFRLTEQSAFSNQQNSLTAKDAENRYLVFSTWYLGLAGPGLNQHVIKESAGAASL